MRRILPLLFLTLAGCSNAPVAGFLDSCFPSRAKADPPAPPGPGVDVRPPAPSPLDTVRPVPSPGPTPNPGPIQPPAELGP